MEKFIKRYGVKYAELVIRSWDDPKLRSRLIDDTHAVLKENGIKVPRGYTVTVCDGSGDMVWTYADNKVSLPLPKKPSGRVTTLSSGDTPQPQNKFACLCFPTE